MKTLSLMQLNELPDVFILFKKKNHLIFWILTTESEYSPCFNFLSFLHKDIRDDSCVCRFEFLDDIAARWEQTQKGTFWHLLITLYFYFRYFHTTWSQNFDCVYGGRHFQTLRVLTRTTEHSKLTVPLRMSQLQQINDRSKAPENQALVIFHWG